MQSLSNRFAALANRLRYIICAITLSKYSNLLMSLEALITVSVLYL